MERIYLDYGAATPVADEVIGVMAPHLGKIFGNAGSIHSFGQEAHAAIDRSREVIAGELTAKFSEIIFTASATEANNIAIRGVVENADIKNLRIIISSIEHESVLETCESLTSGNVEVVVIPVSKDGFVNVEKLKNALTKETVLVSIIFGSSVIGTLQPIERIGKIIADFRKNTGSYYPLFHTDAAQALQFVEIDTSELMVDALTISGQKIYGPKGVGVLYLGEGWMPRLRPLMTGGKQEFGFRAGTENVAAIAGIGKAIELTSVKREDKVEKLAGLRNYLWENLKSDNPKLEVNGSLENRLPNNLNVYFPGVDALEFLVALDQEGIAVSTGSACSVRAAEPSYVVTALGLGEERANSSIRFTLGGPTTKDEIDKAVKCIAKLLK